MRHAVLLLMILCLVGAMAAPACGQDHTGYALIRGGLYFPTSDLDDKGFDDGISIEAVLGTYNNPNLAIELGVGYFETEAAISTTALQETDEIWVVPVTATVKGVWPANQSLELFGGFGLGVYFLNLDASGTSSALGSFSGDDNDTVVGAHAVVGANINLSPRVFINIEGRYVTTGNADLLNEKLDLDGVTATGGIGYRF